MQLNLSYQLIRALCMALTIPTNPFLMCRHANYEI